eukprot:scaffold55301_cov19-Prasinocladus_malaysianus.AAC.2
MYSDHCHVRSSAWQVNGQPYTSENTQLCSKRSVMMGMAHIKKDAFKGSRTSAIRSYDPRP